MVKAMQISIDRSTLKDDGDTKAVATWIKSFDRLFAQYDVGPVTWEAVESEDKLTFVAWIPRDCMPEFEEAADFIAESFQGYQDRIGNDNQP